MRSQQIASVGVSQVGILFQEVHPVLQEIAAPVERLIDWI